MLRTEGPSLYVRLLGALLLTALVAAPVAAQRWDWAQRASGSQQVLSAAMALDASDNLYVTGYFVGSAAFDSTTLTSEGGYDVFLAKYAPTGEVLWARRAGSPGGVSATGLEGDLAYGVAVDAAGDVYVAGLFYESAGFGNIRLTSAGGYDMFVAKYDASGEVLWAQRAGGTGEDGASDIAIDSDGNVWVGGYFEGTATVGSTALTSAGARDAAIVKFTPTGEVLLARSVGGTDEEMIYTIAIDEAGNVHATGNFTGTAVFGSTMLPSAGEADTFVAKFSPAGEVIWARSAGGRRWDRGESIGVDATGSVYVTGSFDAQAVFGSTTINAAGGYEMFLAKYSEMGELLWVQRGGHRGTDVGRALTFDADGNVWVTGFFAEGAATFGSTRLVGAGFRDVFVVLYTPAGEMVGGVTAGGSDWDEGRDIVFGATGHLYITGTFRRTATFGGTTLTSAGLDDVFVSRLVSTSVATEPALELAKRHDLSAAYPNPFSVRTTIDVSAARTEQVSVTVYDVLGREVAVLFTGTLLAGDSRQLVLDAGSLPAGTYVIRTTGEHFSASRLVTLTR